MKYIAHRVSPPPYRTDITVIVIYSAYYYYHKPFQAQINKPMCVQSTIIMIINEQ